MKNRHMGKTMVGILIVTLLTTTVALPSARTANLSIEKFKSTIWSVNNHLIENNGWHYYASLPNYAPSGMPDFNQYQNNWDNFCGPVALANIVWYIDSKYSDHDGIPGDGEDIFSMVQDYHAPGEPNPGPNTDDHNFNNVNDLESPYDPEQSQFGNELIEKLAWYCDTNAERTGNPDIVEGTPTINVTAGFQMWLQDYDLESKFHVEGYDIGLPYEEDFHQNDYDHYLDENLTFEQIAERVVNGDFVMLAIFGYDPYGHFHFAHWITVVGVNLDSYQLALSNPSRDTDNPNGEPISHNDAANVSHDIVDVTTPYPSFRLVNYGGYSQVRTLVGAAVIITDLQQSPDSPTITGLTNGETGETYDYAFVSNDPELDEVYYYIEWGDDQVEEWVGPYESGEEVILSHSWSEQGTYTIRAKSRDVHWAVSDWATLEVSMPKNKAINTLFFQFLEEFMEHFPVLKYLSDFLFFNKLLDIQGV